jgi:hypothetical protein
MNRYIARSFTVVTNEAAMTASRLTTDSHQYAPMPPGAVLMRRSRITAAAISSAVKNTNISTKKPPLFFTHSKPLTVREAEIKRQSLALSPVPSRTEASEYMDWFGMRSSFISSTPPMLAAV